MTSAPDPSSRTADLIINGRIFAFAHGGILRFGRLLIEALQKSELDWKLAIPSFPQIPIPDVPRSRCIVIPNPNTQRYTLGEVLWNQHLSTWIKQHAPAAVLHNLFHFWAPSPPPRMLLTAYDCIEQSEPAMRTSLPVRIYQQLAWRLAKRAERIMVISEATADSLVSNLRFDRSTLTTIHPWVSPHWTTRPSEEAIASVRRKYALPADYVAYVGGYRIYKNVSNLIRAWALGRDCQKLPPLVLAGQLPAANQDSRDDQVRTTIANSGFSNREIICPGYVDESDLPAFYAGARLFISPSLNEGFGYPPVEAGAVGTPVVVSNIPAYQESVPAPHMRFDPRSPESILERVTAALRDPAQFRLRLRPNHTEEHGFGRYRDLLRQLASDHL